MGIIMLTIYTSYHIHYDIVNFTYGLDSDQVYSLFALLYLIMTEASR